MVACLLQAGDAASYQPVFLEMEPVLDGLVGADAAWERVPRSKGDFYLTGGKEKAPLQTTFKAAFSSRGLFFALECEEPNMDGIMAEKPDMGSLWKEDGFELFIRPAGADEKLQLMVNAIGSRASNEYLGKAELAEFEVMVFLDEQSYSAEVFVPFTTLGFVPEQGQNWRLSVCRNIYTLEKPHYTTWLPSPSNKYSAEENERLLEITWALPAGARRKAREAIDAARAERERTQYRCVVVDRFDVMSERLGLRLLRPGREPRLLVRVSGGHVAPRFAPDETAIFFNGCRSGPIGVYRVAAAGGDPERICDGDQVCVSPAGTAIALRRKGCIIERDLASGDERAVSPGRLSHCAYPAYTPEGSVVFTAANGQSLHLVLPTGETKLLVEDVDVRSPPRCSPDGKYVAFQDGPHLMLYHTVRGDITPLTHLEGVQGFPVWATDSKSLLFCQSPDQFSIQTPVVCRATLDAPFEIGRAVGGVLEKIYAGFDCKGHGPACKGVKRVASEAATAIPASANDGTAEVRNAHIRLSVSAAENKVTLEFRTGQRSSGPLAVTLRGPDGAAGVTIGASETAGLPNGDQSVTVKPEAAQRGDVVCEFILARSRPSLTVIPGRGVGALEIAAPVDRVIVPDRHANDLVLDVPLSGRARALPYAPFTLAALERCGMFLMLVTPDEGQSVHAGTALRLRPLGKPVHISAIMDSGTTGEYPVSFPKGSNRFSVGAAPKFKARYRVTITGEARSFSTMCSVFNTRNTTIPVTVPSGCFRPDETLRAVVYPYAPNIASSYREATPLGVLNDVLGLEKTATILDTRGLRGCRVGAVESPFKDYRLSLLMLAWIKKANDASTRSIANFCGDLTGMLEGLDDRTAEYKAALAAIAELVKAHAAAGDTAGTGAEPLTSLIEGVAPVPDPATPFDAVQAAADKLVTVDGYATWYGSVLPTHKARYDELATLCNRAFPERAKALQAYREILTGIRDRAGRAILTAPGARRQLEAVRGIAGQTLRDRYYLEADWRGESQLNPEKVDYDSVKNK